MGYDQWVGSVPQLAYPPLQEHTGLTATQLAVLRRKLKRAKNLIET